MPHIQFAINIAFTDYYPFGSPMPGRNSNSADYRFGFNGQEMDNEISGQTGTHTTAMFWEYDARLGRRWNVDPVLKQWESPYLCFSGNPIWFSDVNGDDVGYEKGRDKVNSFFARVFSSSYRKEFRRMKGEDKLYTIRKRDNNPTLSYGGKILPVDENNSDVLYSKTGGLNSPIGIDSEVNISSPLSINRHIDKVGQPSESLKQYNLKNVDAHSPITIAPYGHPDFFNVSDNTGTSLFNGSIVASQANRTYASATSSDGSFTLPAPAVLSLRIPNQPTNRNGDACIIINPTSTQISIQTQSINAWNYSQGGNQGTSRETTSNYRIEWRQKLFVINFRIKI